MSDWSSDVCPYVRLDFLLSTNYARRYGMRLLPDPSVSDLYGSTILLSHGDLLCSDDVAYQQFRRQVRAPEWQAAFLAQSLAQRAAFAANARVASQAHQQGIDETIHEVNPDTLDQWLAPLSIAPIIYSPTQHLPHHA